MSAKKFLEDALGSALDLQIATHDDVLRHVTTDVLSIHLPRPLWARLLTACLGAPRVDAQLVIETVGVPNLCEHVPSTILWKCVAEVAARALGKPEAAAAIPVPVPKQSSSPVPLAPPPPEAPRPRATPPGPIPAQQGPSIPSVTQSDGDASRPAQRFRQAGTGIGGSRIGQPQARRPQAQAAPAPAPAPTPARNVVRRGATDLSENETETAVESEWRGKEIAVDDSQLVDWSTETTSSRDDDFSDLGRKR